MGPGPRGPGNAPEGVGSYTWILLQWGRDRAVPEMYSAEQTITTKVGLQWGRDRAVPEMTRRGRWPKRPSCFNGAGTARSRKSPAPPLAAEPPEGFNGAGTARSRKFLGMS